MITEKKATLSAQDKLAMFEEARDACIETLRQMNPTVDQLLDFSNEIPRKATAKDNRHHVNGLIAGCKKYFMEITTKSPDKKPSK